MIAVAAFGAHAQVYSLNVVSIHSVGCHWGYEFGPSWLIDSPVGPFGEQGIAYWTDTSGRVLNDLNRRDQVGDKRHLKTGIYLGPASFCLPISPRWSAVTVVVALLVLGYLLLEFLLRRSNAARDGPART